MRLDQARSPQILARAYTEHDASAVAIVRQLVDALERPRGPRHDLTLCPSCRDDETAKQAALMQARAWLEQEAK